MNRIKKFIPGIWLADTAVFTAAIILLSLILHCLGLMFRKWVIIIGALIIAAGVTRGVYQLLTRISKAWLKVTLITVFTALIIAGGTEASFVIAHPSARNPGSEYDVQYWC